MKSFFHHILNNSDIVLTSEIRVKMNALTHVHFLWNSKSGAAGKTKSEFQLKQIQPALNSVVLKESNVHVFTYAHLLF